MTAPLRPWMFLCSVLSIAYCVYFSVIGSLKCIKRLDKWGGMIIMVGTIEFKLRLGQEQVLTP